MRVATFPVEVPYRTVYGGVRTQLRGCIATYFSMNFFSDSHAEKLAVTGIFDKNIFKDGSRRFPTRSDSLFLNC